ncbi:putative xylan 1,4-beta-xylosidase [Dioscorea sansibarensis]
MANIVKLLIILFLSFFISASSRFITPSSSSSSSVFSNLTYIPGPIQSNGKNYTKVCDPERFADMGLNMEDFAYCDKSLPYSVRIKDLIGRMTVREKILNLGDRAPGSGRVGLQNYNWWTEALHGISDVGHATYFGDIVNSATVFPTPILTVSSFDPALWKKIGHAVSIEGRAMYNLGHAGLTVWSPNINIVRDPRWGRALETPGEDPFAVSVYAVNYVRGLQDVKGFETAKDPNTRPLSLSACCKHYTAYDVDQWYHEMYNRKEFDAKTMERDMVETFNRPFESCVREGDGSSIMCSYNKINGVPVCANPRLMSQTFRGEWDLHGYIVSDCDSVQVITENHKWLHDSPVDAIAQSLSAGLDLDCGCCGVGDNYFQNFGESAVQQGRIREKDLDNALTNLYTVLMRVGFFDGNPLFDKLGLSDICSKEHIELSAKAAREGIVLLKNNDNSVIPLDSNKFKKIALIGPLANATEPMRGNYAGVPCKYITPIDGFNASNVQVDYQQGCDDVACQNISELKTVLQSVKHADATVLFFGNDLSIEREEFDRDGLKLPGKQEELIIRAAESAKGPVVLVLMSGGGLDVSFAEKHPKIGAILWAGYPGEQGGHAIADIVFGKYNPGGRLPLTWYHDDYVKKLPMTSLQLRPNKEFGYPGRTYRFYDGPVVYPFGHGLSYTQYKYTVLKSKLNSINVGLDKHHKCKDLTLKSDAIVTSECPSAVIDDLKCEETISFSVEVANVGKMDGDHTVMVYSKPPEFIDDAPIKQLIGFQKVFVPAGKKKVVKFDINACKALTLVEKTAYKVLAGGQHTIVIGHGDDAVSFPFEVFFKN